jgi:hypothetical protein
LPLRVVEVGPCEPGQSFGAPDQAGRDDNDEDQESRGPGGTALTTIDDRCCGFIVRSLSFGVLAVEGCLLLGYLGAALGDSVRRW